MSETEITARQLKAFQRFLERLPHGKDVDLVILKAHLLIEEQINAIISERLEFPEILVAEERFESSYRIRLAQAFFKRDHLPWMWHSVLQLNKLRNRVAHCIDPKGRENLMRDIVVTIPSLGGQELRPLGERFEFALWLLFESVSSLVEHSRE